MVGHFFWSLSTSWSILFCFKPKTSSRAPKTLLYPTASYDQLTGGGNSSWDKLKRELILPSTNWNGELFLLDVTHLWVGLRKQNPLQMKTIIIELVWIGE